MNVNSHKSHENLSNRFKRLPVDPDRAARIMLQPHGNLKNHAALRHPGRGGGAIRAQFAIWACAAAASGA